MTLARVRNRRWPYLMRRRLSRTGSANLGAFENACDVVADGMDVRSDADDVIVSVCNPFDVIVGTDAVCVGDDEVIIGAG